VSTPLPPPGSGSTTSTQEIPVVPAAVANTQHLPPPPVTPEVEVPDGTRTTGPVDFVPQPPRSGGPGVTGSGRRLPVRLLAPAAAVLGLAVLELGLLLRFGSRSLWSQIPLWSSFATLVAAVALGTLAGPAVTGRGSARDGKVGLAALACLAVFWLLVVLPLADTDRGFVLTAGVALLGAGAWLGRSRREG
jgi:hypothetical protein